MNILSLCTGTGALDAAVQSVFGGQLVAYSEFDPKIGQIMTHHRPDLKNLGDVKSIIWPAPGEVDIITAGYPCQPFSAAGKRQGAQDERHLWPHIAKGISVSRPGLIVLENVRGHLSLGFKEVLQDLARLGYDDCRWGVVRASDVGAPHQRARLFVIATDADSERSKWTQPLVQGYGGRAKSAHGNLSPADADSAGRGEHGRCCSISQEQPAAERSSGVDWGKYEPAVRRWEHVLGRPAPEPTEPGTKGNRRLSAPFVEWMMGLPEGHVTDVPGLTRTVQLKALGNGVVPQQAELALRVLLGR